MLKPESEEWIHFQLLFSGLVKLSGKVVPESIIGITIEMTNSHKNVKLVEIVFT
jgi:hypothetical protein